MRSSTPSPNPPLRAWAAGKLYESDGGREFLDEIYGPIVRWNAWWFERNDPDGDGLCEYLHPFSSGLDDSPLWDSGMPVTSPDLNSYLFLQEEALGGAPGGGGGGGGGRRQSPPASGIRRPGCSGQDGTMSPSPSSRLSAC